MKQQPHQLALVCSRFVLALLTASLMACGGGSANPSPGAAPPPRPPPPAPGGGNQQECIGQCANATTFLNRTLVGQAISQAVAEAQALGVGATIAVVDRAGNVLGVFQMNGAQSTVTITSERGVSGGLEGIAVIPAELAAIAKAITGAYLSSEGNAFSTRTASQIIQEHFNPGEFGQPSGPLFGVQFSQLPCSDLMTRFQFGADAGPKRSPLGLSADPGGLPLYMAGTPVGGIGVIADGLYSLDAVTSDRDMSIDEHIALAGAFGLGAPDSRRAGRITVEGKSLRFSDAADGDLNTNPNNALSFDQVNGSAGQLLTVTGYSNGLLIDGTAFGQPASGFRPDLLDYPGLDAFVLVDNNNLERFRPRAGSDGANALTASEVQTIMQQALTVANRARAQIRQPLGSQARVTVSIVDTNGVVLALARTRDAPVFGTDVSLQKARTAAFFSNANAANDLFSAPNTIYRNSDASPSGIEIIIGDYVADLRQFLDQPQALGDGLFAFSDRAGGNLSRPYFPDGVINGSDGPNPNGPLSKPFPDWSPFSVGLQLDLVMNRVVEHVLHVATAGAIADTPMNCTTLPRLPNGTQIFPGSVPIYRGDTLVGGIGVSGDGVDQDDMIAFLGLYNAAQILGTINNAPPERRADQLTPRGTRLRYVQCPQAPFIDSDEQNVCAGL